MKNLCLEMLQPKEAEERKEGEAIQHWMIQVNPDKAGGVWPGS